MNRDIEESQIKLITQDSPPRERAFFTIMRQSGLTPEAIKKLRISNVEGILERYTPAPCKIEIPEQEGKNGKISAFIGEEAIKYTKRYLQTRTNLNSESLLFTVRNNPNKEVNTKDVSRTFRLKSKSNALKLYSLVYFYRKRAKDYLKELEKYGSLKDDDFCRKLYEEKALPFLEIELPPIGEITKLKQRLARIENTLLPKSRTIADPIAEARKIEEWVERNPEEAKLEQEREEYWEREREEEFKAYQQILKENPEGLISYLQVLEEKIEVLKIIIKQQIRTRNTKFS